jgi:Mg2+/Co2+ transporter CorB
VASLTFTVLGVGAILGLVGLSAFFSSSETAIFTLTDQWLDAQGPSDDRRLSTLRELRRDPHRLLVTILLGNNVVNVAIGSLTTVLAIEYLPTGLAVTAATVIASFTVLVFGEIVPKSYGLGQAPRWALAVAGPVSLVERALYPLVAVFDAVTRRVNARLGGEPRIERPYVDD